MIRLQPLKLEETDRALVRRFARDHDGETFSILMGRYADMVYTTCRRILGDEAQAADAVQETFFQLVKNADRVTGSLGGWLHRVATRRAVDIIRQNASRRRREEAYTLEGACEATTWSEVVPAVDEALEQLPEELREVLMLHFLQGRTTIQISAAKGVSQPTISRRMTEALELLRQKLRDQGINAALVPLQTVLLHSNHMVPEALRLSLGKIALAKAAWVSSSSVPVAGAGVKIALAGGALILVLSTVWVLRHEPKLQPVSVAQPAITLPAKPVAEFGRTESTPPGNPPPREQAALANAQSPVRQAVPPNSRSTLEPARLPAATPGSDPTPWTASGPQNPSPVPMDPGAPPSYTMVPMGQAAPWQQPALPAPFVPANPSLFYSRFGGPEVYMQGGIYKTQLVLPQVPGPTNNYNPAYSVISSPWSVRGSPPPSAPKPRAVPTPSNGDSGRDRRAPSQ